MQSTEDLKKMASQVRRDIIRMVVKAKSGHPGGSMSSADFMTALYFNVMDQNPATWTREGKDQDMFILSAGHLTPMYYSILARAGYFPIAELESFRKFGTRLQGHPSVRKGLPGVFQAAGSLGQGLSVAIGAALAKKADNDPHCVYVLCGDGETEEGQIWEAGMWAVHHKVDNLIAFTDWNGQQIDGPTTTITGIEDLSEKWGAFGWDVIIADGHDYESILNAFTMAHKANGKPKMILFKTEMGHGVDFMAGTHEWHGKAPSAEQCEAAMKQLPETLGDF